MKKENKPLVSILFGIVSFLLLTIFDQLTKQWAVLFLRGKDSIVLIQNVFQLYYLENHGAAFGMLQGKQMLFIVFTAIVLCVIAYLYVRLPYTRKYRCLRVLFVLILSGAVGNFIDRITNNYVVDFFYFSLIDFPVFNVADIYVTCATILLVLVVLVFFKDEDFEEMKKSIKRKNK